MPAFILLTCKQVRMYCTVVPKDIVEIQTGNIVQQTSFWAKVKRDQGSRPFAFEYHASQDLLSPEDSPYKWIQQDLLVLLQKVNSDYSIAYVPYGPVDEPVSENHGPFLEELSEVLRKELPGNCIMIRYDLPWENQWAAEDEFFDDQGNWLGPPPINLQEFRVNFNTKKWNLHKSFSDNLPANTIFLNLNQSDEEILMQMKAKTRYNIRLASRKDVRVRNYSMDHLDKWYALYTETALRNKITLHHKEFFSSVLTANMQSDDVEIQLLMADLDGECLAAMFLIISGRRGTYLYGATSGKKRNYMASYALQWKAIQTAKRHGCSEYDMFGTAPNSSLSHPMHGLYRFKSGFGGHLFHRMGCWDYPLDESTYGIFRAQEVNQQSYHL